MDLTSQLKQEINDMSYEAMLWKYRFSPIGDEMFMGESGMYYRERMGEKREQCDGAAVSKAVGWRREQLEERS